MNKLIFSVPVYYVEPYFPYVIKNIYPYADKIIVFESYEVIFAELIGSSWIQKQLKDLDPDKKIHYKHGGIVKDKFEIMQKLLEETKQFLTPEDWYIVTAADEFWHVGALAFLKKQDKDVYWVGFPFINFIGDFTHYIEKDKEKMINDRSKEGEAFDRDRNILVRGLYEERAIRVLDGFSYQEENFTAIKDKDGFNIHAASKYRDNRIYIPWDEAEESFFHVGYVGSAGRLLRKILYHHRRNVPSLLEFDKSDLFRYIFYGKPGKLVVKEGKFRFPEPLPSHPLFKKTRKEILLSDW